MTKKQFPAHRIIATCFGLGYTPFCPGTAASFAAMLLLYFLPPISIIAHFITLNVIFFVGTIAAEWVIIETGKKDPSYIVIDEWFGMWLALFLANKSIWLYLLAFLIFRVFDILKPKPISHIEKHTPGGLGVMLDDAAAGFFTFVIIQGINFFL